MDLGIGNLGACLGPQCYEGARTEKRITAYFLIMFNILIDKHILDLYSNIYIKCKKKFFKNQQEQISGLLASLFS